MYIYMHTHIYIHICESSCNPNPSTLKTDRLQLNDPAAPIIAQQYSSFR